MAYAIFKAIRHPRTPMKFFVCGCGCRFPASEKECPKCGDKLGNTPERKEISAIPWWGSCIVILVGIGAWVASAYLKIPGLDEAARALVYLPLGNLFGMSIQR